MKTTNICKANRKTISVIVVTSCMLILHGNVLGQPAGSQSLSEQEYVWDFGQVKEGAVLHHNFTFKNETPTVLNISRVQSPSASVIPRIQKVELSPGESTEISIQVDTSRLNGLTEYSVILITDNSKIPAIKYTVKAQPQ